MFTVDANKHCYGGSFNVFQDYNGLSSTAPVQQTTYTQHSKEEMDSFQVQTRDSQQSSWAQTSTSGINLIRPPSADFSKMQNAPNYVDSNPTANGNYGALMQDPSMLGFNAPTPGSMPSNVVYTTSSRTTWCEVCEFYKSVQMQRTQQGTNTTPTLQMYKPVVYSLPPNMQMNDFSSVEQTQRPFSAGSGNQDYMVASHVNGEPGPSDASKTKSDEMINEWFNSANFTL